MKTFKDINGKEIKIGDTVKSINTDNFFKLLFEPVTIDNEDRSESSCLIYSLFLKYGRGFRR